MVPIAFELEALSPYACVPTPTNFDEMTPIAPVRGPLNPSLNEMRLHARQQIEESTGETLRRVSGQRVQHCFRLRNGGPLVHLHVNKPAQRRSNPAHRVYFFGEAAAVWDDSDGFLVLQCGLDFTLLAPIADWRPYQDRVGVAGGGARINQHVHWLEGERVELRERNGFRLRLDSGDSGLPNWVNNFSPLVE